MVARGPGCTRQIVRYDTQRYWNDKWLVSNTYEIFSVSYFQFRLQMSVCNDLWLIFYQKHLTLGHQSKNVAQNFWEMLGVGGWHGRRECANNFWTKFFPCRETFHMKMSAPHSGTLAAPTTGINKRNIEWWKIFWVKWLQKIFKNS